MKLDLNIGDIILTGRFKNKAVEVKEFGTDEKGQPTINGRPILKFRIKKLIPENKKMNKARLQQIIKEEVANVLNEQAPKMRSSKEEKKQFNDLLQAKRLINGIENRMKAHDSSKYSHMKGAFRKINKALENFVVSLKLGR